MLKELLPALRLTVILALLTGLAFPLFITAASQLMFADQANGSLVRSADGKVIGSRLLAQRFEAAKYFHPRPSAAGSGYAGEASGGTNLGPTSAKLINGIQDDPKTKADESFAGVKQLTESYRKENELPANAPVPVDAVTRSASGLDPDISENNALLQVPRIAKARNLTADSVTNLVHKCKTERELGILGEPRINVLLLNIALDNNK
jgi:K+-transporting ATPase ATPase C chain